MNIPPGIYFSRIDFGFLVYDGSGLYPVLFSPEVTSKSFVVDCLGEEFEVNLLETKVKRLKDGEERRIVEVSDSGISFEPFKL